MARSFLFRGVDARLARLREMLRRLSSGESEREIGDLARSKPLPVFEDTLVADFDKTHLAGLDGRPMPGFEMTERAGLDARPAGAKTHTGRVSETRGKGAHESHPHPIDKDVKDFVRKVQSLVDDAEKGRR